ncbi:MAG: hypothetical protein AB7E79_17215 [Rhodospirillaceae bacterium]
MTRLLRDVALAAATMAIVAGATWMYLSVTTVTVRNKTDQPLSNVEVGFGEKSLWKGNLESGDSKWAYGTPRQDGSVEVSYAAGETMHQIQCGYVSPGPGGRTIVVEILPGGRSNCEDNP